VYYDTFPYSYTGDFDTFSDLSLAAASKIKHRLRVISQAALDLEPEGVRAAERRAWGCYGVNERSRQCH
jgi:hypothetical protein